MPISARKDAPAPVKPPPRQRARRLLIFISLLAFPITLNFLSPYLIIQASFEGVIAGSALVFAALFILSIFLGRLFCGWLCPGGGLNDILTTINNQPVNGRGIRRLKFVIWTVWLITLVAGFIVSGGPRRVAPLFMTESGISVDEPIKYIIYYSVIFVFMIISLLVGRRASCHAICWMAPFMILGVKLGDFLHVPRVHIESSSEHCIRCERCIKQCPMSIPVLDLLGTPLARHTDCSLCGECVDICPKSCLHYSFKANKRK